MSFKSINILYLFTFLFLFASCGNTNQEKEAQHSAKDSISIPKDINSVVGIGKVEPQKGIIDLASKTGGIVKAVYKQSGDSIKKGETIIVLQQDAERLKIQEIKTKIATQKQQVEAKKIQVQRFQTQFQDKTDKLKISKNLLQSGAETKENVTTLQNDKKLLKIKLKENKKDVGLSIAKVRELKAKLATAQNKLRNRSIDAPSDGVILNITAKAGSAIQPLQSFATYAPSGDWVIHGEADEMFANRLKIGQKVSIHYIGNSHIITTGKIISLSPDLSNKSLFTDEPGEQQDRRVRRFKVLLNNRDHLLINSKVECNIHINDPA